MTSRRDRYSLLGLQWSLGLVVLVEALFLAFSPKAIQAFGRTGLPDLMRIVLACGEILGAVLFLIPRTVAVGGWSLVVVFSLAAMAHLLHGMMGIGTLLVYTAAVIVVMIHRRERA